MATSTIVWQQSSAPPSRDAERILKALGLHYIVHDVWFDSYGEPRSPFKDRILPLDVLLLTNQEPPATTRMRVLTYTEAMQRVQEAGL